MSEHQEDSTVASEQQQQHEEDQLTLRALVSTREAGVIIGKGGKNVAGLRDATGVKAGVSKVVQGVHDRVLTVSGTLEGVAMAYSLIARTMIDNPVAANTMDGNTSQDASDNTGNAATATNTITTLRLLISHNLMGTVIGRQGAKIKHIQDNSGVRMTASKTLLPQSTERVVEVRGTVEAILQAISEIGACLIEDKDRAYGTILYNPTKVTSVNDRRTSFTRTGNGSDFNQTDFSTSASSLSQPSRRTSYQPPPPHHSQQPPLNADVRTQQISIPSDMVGCIIGKGGSKISEIRRLSGSHISIAKTPHDDSGERMFTIQGTMESNERALYLLYGQLENEKERRLQGVVLQQQQQQQQQDDVLLEEEE
ncbi:transcriptional regulator opi1 [Mucor velutinosus]|uniref:Transcriptional regulator opi1 n=1 Tax=Mucor velutinosus TaxID=708070 RepID=A0AAN7D8Q6_9FUNG|nr:transcriptional regulator opi1 [Mucor velutinosus]